MSLAQLSPSLLYFLNYLKSAKVGDIVLQYLFAVSESLLNKFLPDCVNKYVFPTFLISATIDKYQNQ